MKIIRHITIALLLLFTFIFASCGAGSTKPSEDSREFFGVRMGDDSTTVVRELRKNKIAHLDSISGGAGWMNFMKQPSGFMLYDDELWEMLSVHLVNGKTNVVRLTNSYPTRQEAEKEYRGMARRLSTRYALQMTDKDHQDFVIMKCIATTQQGGLTFALTNAKSLNGRPIYNVVLEFY
jgi:hypothetical protein